MSDLPEFVGRVLVGDFLASGAPWLMALGLVCLLALVRVRDVDPLWWAWAFVPLLGTWLVSRFSPISVFEYKYFVWTVPAWCVLLARLLGARGVAMLLLVNLGTLVVSDGVSQDWRAAALAVRSQRQPGDVVLVHPSMMAAPLLYYGFAPGDMNPTDEVAQLEGLQGRVWLVGTPYHPVYARSGLEAEMSRRGVRLSEVETRPLLPSAVVRISLWDLKKGAAVPK